MIDRGKQNLLGVLVNAVDYEAAAGRILAAARRREPLAATALAVHGLMTGALDCRQRQRLNRLDLVVPDGQPLRWSLNLLYRAGLPDRVYGPRLMLEICRRAAQEDLPLFLFGSTPAVLARLAEALPGRFPGLRLAGARPSLFRRLAPAEREALAREIAASGARAAFVGLGCPRQEVWIYENRARLALPLVAVGAAFDFHAGTLAQAPAPLQRLGLEWLYRLAREPRRLWRRYLGLNPLFLALIALQAAGLRVPDPAAGQPPPDELGYG